MNFIFFFSSSFLLKSVSLHTCLPVFEIPNIKTLGVHQTNIVDDLLLLHDLSIEHRSNPSKTHLNPHRIRNFSDNSSLPFCLENVYTVSSERLKIEPIIPPSRKIRCLIRTLFFVPPDSIWDLDRNRHVEKN